MLIASRWYLLKRPENGTKNQATKRKELVAINLKTVRAHLFQHFQRFLDYKSVWWATNFLDDWCKRTMRSLINPIKKIARLLRSHRSLVLSYFRAIEQIALGAVEGLNN